MKKMLSIVLTLVMALSFMTGCGAAEQEAGDAFTLTMQIGNPIMTVNGESKNIDNSGTAPMIDNDRTLVPIRAVIEAMGGAVTWNGETSTAVLTLGDDVISLVIGSDSALLNGETHKLDAAPKIINDRTMLPLRFIAESFKFDVNWEAKTQTITITKDMATTGEAAKTDVSQTGKTLVVYYSATGSTQAVANYIKAAKGADIFELVPTETYTSADLNWTDKSSRVNIEHDDENKRNIKLENTTVPNFDAYDTVFIGYPIWWGIAAWPVNQFVKDNDFSGKTVIPFCTSASSGLGESGKLLAEMAGTGDWKDGMRFSSGVSEADVAAWVNGLK